MLAPLTSLSRAPLHLVSFAAHSIIKNPVTTAVALTAMAAANSAPKAGAAIASRDFELRNEVIISFACYAACIAAGVLAPLCVATCVVLTPLP